MKNTKNLSLLLLMLTLVLTACGNSSNNSAATASSEPTAAATGTAETSAAPAAGAFKDGTYKAEYDRNDVRNWKAYVEVTVNGGKIEKAYYDYINEKGELRSQNEAYIKGFSEANKFTPREAFDKLGQELVTSQDAAKVDAVSGASHSSRNFNELAAAVLGKAEAGDTATAIVPLYEDGTYKVAADAFDDHGWKPQIDLEIKDHKIASVQFDYVNEAGKLKTEDADYKTAMEAKNKTYPAKYTEELEKQLVEKQSIGSVDAVSGATTSSNNFTALVEYALDDLAEVGDTKPAAIKIEE
ncbi:Major membrane immunogen, membrane-anchored lipoprotein [Paenibacillus sophorae]|uniref:FMN-binding protein n=1 Tax=Paenibacillus sophorae TaxID=1333845 RepID=A0A1H8IP52_9BACL|nr:FMN-binding protein [Paenibacillus sophorae]QWU16024.1 FMN-binding protein [Paenibacillus sophorae]SEN70189.1 Major membrane immunogen, membrane-anchored lipoprotein [Paenibacillus sophorae]